MTQGDIIHLDFDIVNGIIKSAENSDSILKSLSQHIKSRLPLFDTHHEKKDYVSFLIGKIEDQLLIQKYMSIYSKHEASDSLKLKNSFMIQGLRSEFRRILR